MSPDERERDAHALPAGLALLAEALPQTRPAPSVRERLLVQLAGPERWTPWAGDVAHHFGLQHCDALDALRRIPDASAWLPGPWAGSRLLLTDSLLRASAMIACLPQGLRIAPHRHAARELTYILDGELVSNGLLRGSGCLLDMPRGSEHSVFGQSECLVVFSASAPEVHAP